jgi:hypothetical protein
MFHSGSPAFLPFNRLLLPLASGRLWRLGDSIKRGLAQSDPAATSLAARMVRDHFYSGPIERRDDLGQGIDDTAHVSLARFHALDGRQRYPGKFGQRLLIDPEQSSGCTQLRSCDHAELTFFESSLKYRSPIVMSRTSFFRPVLLL